MKEKFIDDEVGEILYDTDLQAIILTSKPQKDSILPEEKYKQFLQHYLDAFLKYKPYKVLMDFRDFVFPMTDEIEQWTTENISNITYKNGLKYIAYIYPQEVVTQFGLESFVERMIKTYGAGGPVRMIFKDFEEAYKWIESK